LAWPYFSVPNASCARFQSRSAASVFTGARFLRDVSHALKSRFMPYLSTTEQSSSPPLASLGPLQMPQASKLSAGRGVTTDGMSAGSTIVAPAERSAAMASFITARSGSVSPPVVPRSPGAATAS
jgi:hypothetical protein